MKYKITVDKQPRTNPTAEKREYEIDIEELRYKGNIADSLIITKDEDYVMRRLSLSEYHVLSVLEEPIKETIQDINIELFEGENYIYIQDMVGNKFYAEYLVKNDFTDTYVTINQMNSAINQSAGQIKLSVSQRLEEYATSKELEGAVTSLNSTITQTAKDINLEVSKKVNDEELTGANIALRINNDTSEAQIKADKININGAISANGNFKVNTDGNIEIKDGNISMTDDGNLDNAKVECKSSDYKTTLWSMGVSVMPKQHPGFEASILPYLITTEQTDKNGNPVYGISLDINRSEAIIDIFDHNQNCRTEIKSSGITTPVLTQTSQAESKKNFEKLKNGLDILKQVEIYKYNLKSQKDEDKKHIGFVIGKDYKYSSEITTINEKGEEVGVDIYSMASVLWKAVQELTAKVEKLEQEVQNGQD